MTPAQHPAASHHLPWFLTAPGDSDILFTITTIVVLLIVLGLGVVFFRLHSLPEHIAHKSHKVQMEIVSVLCLISLFTHMHIFWIVGLLLAFIDIPDFGTPLKRIAGGVEKIAGVESPLDEEEAARTAAIEPHEPKPADRTSAASQKPAAATSRKAPSHA